MATQQSASASTATSASVHPASNLVVLVGEVASPPTDRRLADGVAWQFDVATSVITPDGGVHRATVPVNWLDPSAAEIDPVTEGVEVLIVGSVRRRFFRVGGTTQSRTEVAPDRVVPLRRRASVRSALAAVAARLA